MKCLFHNDGFPGPGFPNDEYFEGDDSDYHDRITDNEYFQGSFFQTDNDNVGLISSLLHSPYMIVLSVILEAIALFASYEFLLYLS